jgi:hypothetical protein
MLLRGVHWVSNTRRSSRKGGHIHNLCFNPGLSFLKQLLIKQALLDVWRGWVAAAGVAAGTLAKHIAIMEKRGQQQESDREAK